MRILKATLMASLMVALLTGFALANGVDVKTKRRTISLSKVHRISVNGNPIRACEVRKPISEYAEDGLALIFDIPLAMLSPITCPVVSRILDVVDPVENRSYQSYGRKR